MRILGQDDKKFMSIKGKTSGLPRREGGRVQKSLLCSRDKTSENKYFQRNPIKHSMSFLLRLETETTFKAEVTRDEVKFSKFIAQV